MKQVCLVEEHDHGRCSIVLADESERLTALTMVFKASPKRRLSVASASERPGRAKRRARLSFLREASRFDG